MSDEAYIPTEVPGVADLIQWFGCWPSFHDNEVLSISLDRNGPSIIKLQSWNMTSSVDDKGYFVLEKHCVISFIFDTVTDLELADFSCQNVVFGLRVAKTIDGHEVILDPCFGVAGRIAGSGLHVQLSPGKA